MFKKVAKTQIITVVPSNDAEHKMQMQNANAKCKHKTWPYPKPRKMNSINGLLMLLRRLVYTLPSSLGLLELLLLMLMRLGSFEAPS